MRQFRRSLRALRQQLECVLRTGDHDIEDRPDELCGNLFVKEVAQRIEQRIGRCHRYGQKHDVVVVNFLNKRNEADQRVYQLLSEKFKLFEGVFGSSDEVLGAVESGVDIERRIAEVYQTCRTSDEISAAFDRLQRELDEQIQARMSYFCR